MKTAYIRLMIRPAVLFWMLWVASLVFPTLVADGYHDMGYIIGSVLSGMILGQLNRDLQNRLFSWHLPNIRKKLRIDFFMVFLVFCVLFASLMPSDLDWLTRFAVASLYFSTGSVLKTAQYTFFEFTISESMLALFFVISSVLYVDILFVWIDSNPYIFMGTAIAGVAFFFKVLFSRTIHRRTLFETIYPIVTAINSKALSDFQRMKVIASKRGEHIHVEFKLSGVQTVTSYLKAVFLESTLGISFWKFIRNYLFASFMIALFVGYAKYGPAFDWSYMILILVFIMCFQFPLVFREKLLHPLSRLMLFKINHFSMIVESLLYLVMPFLLMFSLQLLPMPELVFRKIILTFNSGHLLIHTAMLCLVFMPVIQYRRRKSGLALPSFIFTITLIIVVVMAALAFIRVIHMSTIYYFCSYSGLIVISQFLLFTFYRKLSLKGDMRLDGI